MSVVRVVPEDELSYCRGRVVAWFTKTWPTLTLEQCQSIAVLLAVERQKAIAEAGPPRRERRVAMPITLPAPEPDFEGEVTTPRGNK